MLTTRLDPYRLSSGTVILDSSIELIGNPDVLPWGSITPTPKPISTVIPDNSTELIRDPEVPLKRLY